MEVVFAVSLLLRREQTIGLEKQREVGARLRFWVQDQCPKGTALPSLVGAMYVQVRAQAKAAPCPVVYEGRMGNIRWLR
jgi:hypothetical protein